MLQRRQSAEVARSAANLLTLLTAMNLATAVTALPATENITLTINGQERRLAVAPWTHAARSPARVSRSDGQQKRLRPRPVRRVHGARQRTARALLPHHGRDQGWGRSDHHRRVWWGRTARSTPCSRRFVDCDAFQCGYCTPGQILLGGGDDPRRPRALGRRDPRGDERQRPAGAARTRTSCSPSSRPTPRPSNRPVA